MELKNVRHIFGKIDEILEIDFQEDNDIVAKLTIVKDYSSFEKYSAAYPEEEVLRKVRLPSIDPFYQTISIETYTDKDSYIASVKEIENSHQQIAKKVGEVLKTIASIDPVYTREDSIPEGENTVEYNARLITNTDVMAIVMQFLYKNNISIEDVVKVKTEDAELQIKKENIHRI